MAEKFLGTFDPKEVSLILSGFTMTGFFDGTFITCARIDGETYKTHVGAYGEVGRTKNNNTAGTITFVLKKTSPSNRTMSLLKLNPSTFPVMKKDNSSIKQITLGSSAWVSNEPTIEDADEETGIEWVVTVADMNMVHI